MPPRPSRFEFVYAPDHDTLTVWFAAEGRTAHALTHGQDCIFDFDSRGGLMFVEILNASRYYSPAELRSLPLPTEEELTLSEAAAETGLSVDTLRAQIRNGRLPATKKGRDWLVTGRDLVAYAESRSPRGRLPASRKAARARREQKKARAASR